MAFADPAALNETTAIPLWSVTRIGKCVHEWNRTGCSCSPDALPPGSQFWQISVERDAASSHRVDARLCHWIKRLSSSDSRVEPADFRAVGRGSYHYRS